MKKIIEVFKNNNLQEQGKKIIVLLLFGVVLVGALTQNLNLTSAVVEAETSKPETIEEVVGNNESSYEELLSEGYENGERFMTTTRLTTTQEILLDMVQPLTSVYSLWDPTWTPWQTNPTTSWNGQHGIYTRATFPTSYLPSGYTIPSGYTHVVISEYSSNFIYGTTGAAQRVSQISFSYGQVVSEGNAGVSSVYPTAIVYSSTGKGVWEVPASIQTWSTNDGVRADMTSIVKGSNSQSLDYYGSYTNGYIFNQASQSDKLYTIWFVNFNKSASLSGLNEASSASNTTITSATQYPQITKVYYKDIETGADIATMESYGAVSGVNGTQVGDKYTTYYKDLSSLGYEPVTREHLTNSATSTSASTQTSSSSTDNKDKDVTLSYTVNKQVTVYWYRKPAGTMTKTVNDTGLNQAGQSYGEKNGIVSPGERFEYTITATNTSSITKSVNWQDSLSDILPYIKESPSAVIVTYKADASSSTITSTFSLNTLISSSGYTSSVAAGKTASLSFYVTLGDTVTSDTIANLDNTAYVVIGDTELEDNATIPTESVDFTIEKSVEDTGIDSDGLFTLAKDGVLDTDEQFAYTIGVTNLSETTKTITIKDTLVDILPYIQETPTIVEVNINNNGVISTMFLSDLISGKDFIVASGKTVTLTFRVTALDNLNKDIVEELENTVTGKMGAFEKEADATIPVAELKGEEFSFMKVDASDWDQTIAGVEFTLYEKTNDTSVPAELMWASGSLYWLEFRSATSSTSGMVDFGLLPDGEYILVETSTVDPYVLPEGQWHLVVDHNATTKIVISARSESVDTMPPAFIQKDNGENEILLLLPNMKPGFIPETGSFTTQTFYYVGGWMVLNSFMLLLMFKNKEKMSNRIIKAISTWGHF